VVVAGGLALLLIEIVLGQTVFGGCHEIRASQFLWLLLVIPPALALFFWWAIARGKIADAIHRGAAAGVADRWHFAGAAENPLRAFDFGRWRF
jgi:hypothetical protein